MVNKICKERIDNKRSLGLVLCTCNSSKYIKEQINSILNQTLLPDQMIIYDDCSNDDTLEMLDEVLKDSQIKYRIVQNTTQIGFVKNFERAIFDIQTDYITLCDHDDIWLPNKNRELYDEMISIEKKFGANMPALVFCDSSLVDENLEITAESFIRSTRVDPKVMLSNKYSLAMQNIVTGMCCMINKDLKQLALPMPENVAVHDWWLALQAHRLGKISFVDKSLVLYRQHNSNCLGAGSDVGLTWINDLKNAIRNLSKCNRGFKLLKDKAVMYRNSYLIRVPHLIEMYKCTDDYNYIIFAELIEQGGYKRLFHTMKHKAAPLPRKANMYFFVMFFIYTFHQKYLKFKNRATN